MLDRRISRIPQGELERRRNLVQALLEERGIDALITFATSNDLGGYQRWLTDTPVTYRRAAIFYRDHGMTVVDHGGRGQRRTLEVGNAEAPGVETVLHVAAFPSIANNGAFEAEAVLADLRHRGVRAVAFAGIESMPYAFAHTVKAGLQADVRIENLTSELDVFRARKSPVEQELLRATAQMQDQVMATILREIRPGLRDADVAAIGLREGRRLGAEFGIYMVGSGPQGTPAFMQPEERQGRIIEPGDTVTILVENGGTGGLFTELGRQAVLGEAGAALIDGFAEADAAQRYTLSLCKPGAACADIFEQYNSYLALRGLPPETRLHAHAQGHDLVERPLIRDDESMLIEPGMCFACHPGIIRPDVFAFICDNYIIGEEGPEASLHKTERRIFEL